MKKLLMIAVLSLFVANAYALETKIYGEYQLGGTWLVNHTLGDDGDTAVSQDATFFRQYLRIFAEISPEPGTKIVLRTTPLDSPQHKFGDGDFGDSAKHGDISLDRAWIQYSIGENLTVLGGRVNFNNFSASGWGQGWYDASFKESSGGDGFGAVYALGDHTVTALVGKGSEGSLINAGVPQGVDYTGADTDAYVLMADLKFGDLGINPRLTYAHVNPIGIDNTATIMGFYIDGQYKPAAGLNAIVALAYVSGSDVNNYGSGEDLSAYGAYADVSYKADKFKAGLRLAYSSYDEEDGAFGFGGDFDKTSYIDNTLFDETGVMAMTFAQIYAEIYMMNGDLTLRPSFAYYMSNINETGATITDTVQAPTFIIGEDTNAMEFDLLASYKLTGFTTLNVGYAMAMVNDIADSYDADMAHQLFWTVSTKF